MLITGPLCCAPRKQHVPSHELLYEYHVPLDTSTAAPIPHGLASLVRTRVAKRTRVRIFFFIWHMKVYVFAPRT
jgi:hypothetical protein